MRKAGRRVDSINFGLYSGVLVQGTWSSLHSMVCKLNQGKERVRVQFKAKALGLGLSPSSKKKTELQRN